MKWSKASKTFRSIQGHEESFIFFCKLQNGYHQVWGIERNTTFSIQWSDKMISGYVYSSDNLGERKFEHQIKPRFILSFKHDFQLERNFESHSIFWAKVNWYSWKRDHWGLQLLIYHWSWNHCLFMLDSTSRFWPLITISG